MILIMINIFFNTKLMTKIYRITLPYINITYLMLNWAKVYKVCSRVTNDQNNTQNI